MKGYLTIGQTAKRLRLGVDRVRQLEREGQLRAVRTQGGHRRFRETDVERLRRQRQAGRAPRAESAPRRSARGPRKTQRPPRAPARPSLAGTLVDDSVWDDDQLGELDDPLDEDMDEEPLPPPRWPSPRPASAPVIAPRSLSAGRLPAAAPSVPPARSMSDTDAARNAARAREEAGKRLETIKNAGLDAIPNDVPPAWRGKVIAELERYVTPSQFPAYVALAEALGIVRDRVQEVLKPYHDQVARQEAARRTEQEAKRRVEALRAHGQAYARDETTDWDFSATVDACQEVDRVLQAEVEADWSERDVETLVDEILNEWDVDDEDEDTDDDPWR